MASLLDPGALPDYTRLTNLEGRRFVMLGTGEGLGRQSAHALRAHGARIACVDVNGAQAEKVAAEISGLAMQADATVRDDLERVFGWAEEELGGVDGIVDVIGGNRPRRESETTDEYWAWILDMCLKHAVHALELGGEALARAGGGTMVFIASGLALAANAEHAPYGAAKAALVSLVRSSALAYGSADVRVNAVAPGSIATPRQLAQWGDQAEEILRTKGTSIPLGRINRTSDIAGVVLFLSSDLSRNMTGQVLVVDGGVGLRRTQFG